MTRNLALALLALGLAGCAANPEPSPAAPAAPAPAAGAISLKPAPAAILDLRASSQWMADERLLPQPPLLALVASGGSPTTPIGLSATCSVVNGAITARLGRQAGERKGQSATFQFRVNGKTRPVSGRFEAGARSGDVDFVFNLSASELRDMANAESVVVLTETGEPSWAFLRDSTAPAQAPHLASLKAAPAATAAFLGFCNPK
jgi:hypothetical protein